VRDIFEEWKRVLGLPDHDPDKQELLEDLRYAHADLSQTVGNGLPPFDQLVPRFKHAFLNTRVIEVNAREGETPQVNWRDVYGWIVVGGQAMDRGFTVEGLTVTYMPRGVGVGNADTVQQRARFFGYKRPYLGYCRVYLEQSTLTAFQNYVDHEEDIRAQLIEWQENGRPLDEWKRAFLLDGRLRPTRHNVLGFDYIQGRFSNDWVSPRIVLASDEVVESNRQVVGAFVRQQHWVADVGHPGRTEVQRHQFCEGVALRAAIETLLAPIRITGVTDSQRNTGLLLQLVRALEDNPNEVCRVYRMSPLQRRQRGVGDDGEVTNLFQGEAPVFPVERRGEVYPGDRSISDPGNVTIQLHTLDLVRNGAVVAQNVPVAAVWVPARMARAWLAQELQV
jgi:hypothetical protein